MAKIRVALIGLGGMGTCHYNAYSEVEDAQIVAVCDVRINELKDKLKNPDIALYDDIDKLLQNEKIDMVDIVTPSFLHAEMAVKCLNKGINVLCEKPMALDAKSCDAMIEAAEKSGKKFMVAHVVRFMKPYSFLKKEIENSKNGKLLRLSMKRTSSIPTWSWKNWMKDDKLSGGVGIDLSIHDVDFVQSVLGLPNSVSAYYRPKKNDSAFILSSMLYGETLVTCEGTWYNAQVPFKAEYFAVFENGYISYDGNKLVKDGVEIDVDKADDGADLGINISGDKAYRNEIAYFVDCIKTNRTPEFVLPKSSKTSVEFMIEILKKATVIS